MNLKTPHQIARKAITDLVPPTAQKIAGHTAVSAAVAAIHADREQLRTSGMLSRFVEAYEAYDGDDVDQFIHDWSGYFAGEDEACVFTTTDARGTEIKIDLSDHEHAHLFD